MDQNFKFLLSTIAERTTLNEATPRPALRCTLVQMQNSIGYLVAARQTINWSVRLRGFLAEYSRLLKAKEWKYCSSLLSPDYSPGCFVQTPVRRGH